MLEQGTNYVLSFSDVLNQTKYSVDYFTAKQSVVDCCNKLLVDVNEYLNMK